MKPACTRGIDPIPSTFIPLLHLFKPIPTPSQNELLLSNELMEMDVQKDSYIGISASKDDIIMATMTMMFY